MRENSVMGNKGVVRTWGLRNILKKSDKKKEEEFRYLGVANCRKANIMGKLMATLVRFVR